MFVARRLSVFAIFLWLLGHVSSANAQYAFGTENEKLKEARSAFEAGHYDDAISAAKAAREVPDNSLEENMEIHRIFALSHALAGRKGAAVEAFKRLLAMDIDHTLPAEVDGSVERAFEKATLFWKGKVSGIVISHDGVSPPAAGHAMLVVARLTDRLTMIHSGALHYRDLASLEFEEIRIDRRPSATRMEWEVPGTDVKAGAEIEYYLEFYDDHGGPVARLGEGRAPRRTIVPGLPAGFSVVEPVDKPKRARVTGGAPPIALYVLAGGAAAAAVGALVWLLIPKPIDLNVVTCIAACE